jgi:Ion transport protein
VPLGFNGIGMKKLVLAFIQSLPDFVNVGVFLIFVFLLFAILGMHQYNGVFYNACRFNSKPETPTSWAIDTSIERICSKTGNGNFICPADRYCGNPAEYDIPLESDNDIVKPWMYYGIHNFDNVLTSL